MRTKQLSQVVLAAATATALVTVAGVAYAYVRTTGSGSGAATTVAGLLSFSTTATAAQGTKLYPGGTGDLQVVINNSANSYPLTVTSVSLDTSRSVTGCNTPAVSVTTPAAWAGITVAAHGTSAATTIVGAVTMGTGASDDCQGKALSIPVTLTGHS